MTDPYPVSPAMPDDYDRQLGSLQGLPGMAKTKPAMLRITPPLGVGGSATYSVTTYRQEGEILSDGLDGNPVKRAPARFTVFLEVAKGERLSRTVIPHDVAALLVRQRDALTRQAQRKAATSGAATRKARGFTPAFARKA